jgi:hypothetical protein
MAPALARMSRAGASFFQRKKCSTTFPALGQPRELTAFGNTSRRKVG